MVLHARRRCIGDYVEFSRIAFHFRDPIVKALPQLLDKLALTHLVKVMDRKSVDAGPEQRVAYCGPGSASTEQKGSLSGKNAAFLKNGVDEDLSVAHVSLPCTGSRAAHDVDGLQKQGPFGRLFAVPERGELVRNGEDEAVQITDRLQRAHDLIEVPRSHVQRDEDRIARSRSQRSGNLSRRLNLTYGVAENGEDPRAPVNNRLQETLLLQVLTALQVSIPRAAMIIFIRLAARSGSCRIPALIGKTEEFGQMQRRACALLAADHREVILMPVQARNTTPVL